MTQDQGQDGDWGPWVEHDGRGCPVPLGMIVEAFAAAPCGCASESIVFLVDSDTCRASVWSGSRGNCTTCFRVGVLIISRYRIRKPRALRDLIDLVENLPVPVQPEKVDV